MRQDQYERMMALEEKLVDVFLDEANPEIWPGTAIPVDQQDKMIRGDRYWHKKNAVATLALINRLNILQGVVQRNTSNQAPGTKVQEEGESDLDKEVNAAEKEAARLMNRIKDPEERKRFLVKTVGKA